jgi:hypothetical protein
VQDSHLIFIPDIATYYFFGGQGSSVLDLTLASAEIMEEVTNWAIDNEHAMGSEHEVIYF